jgi:feruloyl-CoA synthase
LRSGSLTHDDLSGERDGGFAPAAVHCVALPGGGFELAAPVRLQSPLDLIHERLAHWSHVAPDRVFLAERQGGGWRELNYASAARLSANVGASLLERGFGGRLDREAGREHPILIIGEASCAQGILRLAALHAGIPFVPVSPGLLRFGASERLRAVIAKMTPGLIALSPASMKLLPAEFRNGPVPTLLLDDDFLTRSETAPAGSRLAEAESCVTPDTLAAVFLTSGSTGEPKGVEVTQRMIAANQAAYAGVWRFLERAPPVILDWLPWHHTFGGNDNLHKALWFGGSYYIDDGAPTADGIARSVENIGAVAPTIHLNVPRGLALLAERLEHDLALFRRFFERLNLIFVAGAGTSADLWRRWQALVARANAELGRKVALTSGYGTTEAGSTICLVHFPISEPRVVGLPIPGLALRLVPDGDKLEVRIKGPMVTPGYWRDAERTAASFDTDGYFRTGDAARFADPDDPARGLYFDGRLGEDFKLSSGTWVSVGPLRLALLAALAPYVRDILVAGHDRDRIGVVLFPDAEACAQGAELRAAIARGLAQHNKNSPGSSTAVARAIVDPAPLSVTSGELSDKGTLNQRLGLQNRQALVETLFAEPAPGAVIVPQPD